MMKPSKQTISRQHTTHTFNGMRPVHPGEVLRGDYLKPLEMSANALATALKANPFVVSLSNHERNLIATPKSIVRYFGGDVQSWMNLQTAYEIKVAEKLIAKKVLAEVQPLVA